MAARAKHGTLSANTVATVALSAEWGGIEVKNRATAGDIYFRVDGTNPTVAGDECDVVTPGESLLVPTGAGPDTVKLISSTEGAAYSVRGVI